MQWHQEMTKLKGSKNGFTYDAGSESPIPEPFVDRLIAAHQELALQDEFIPDEMSDEEMEMSL